MVSQYLARLLNHTTSTFWGDAPLGDTSLTAGTSSPASWHFEQLSVVLENGARPTGVKEGLWAESEASGWRKAESKRVGGERQSPEQWVDWQTGSGGWMGGFSGKAVKKTKSADEER